MTEWVKLHKLNAIYSQVNRVSDLVPNGARLGKNNSGNCLEHVSKVWLTETKFPEIRLLKSSRFNLFCADLAPHRAKHDSRVKEKCHTGMVGLAPKSVRLDPKLDKSGTFSDQI